ncbi:hypothetical protein AURDEDRAFT_146305 [Auricularia subglabra TFB-10046 SS5]|nr:hypothetical protein AURDEDRAFT_146305 [Auricularia subglabra TFB-10046 SS5]
MRLAVLLILSGLSLGADAIPERNANHIFNAIRASMRQWDSSVHHNGMSFFIASVPRDTQFYHGASRKEPVTGMQWLAFEPEHALSFALTVDDQTHVRAGEGQLPLGPAHPNADSGLGGYLHTYRTKHSLSLLYLDGMSAAKSAIGTLDSTNLVLLDRDANEVRAMDAERAVALCNLTRDEWGGRIDGFLRMQMGFEIILCDFAPHLAVDRIARAPARGSRDTPDRFGTDLPYYRAVASRFDGIGGSRVSVNYEEFVTAFAYDFDLFRGGALPRLTDVSNDVISLIRRDVSQLVMSHPIPAHDTILTTTNWQAVADMVVNRYSARLGSLLAASGIKRLQVDAAILLRPYIDYSARNRSSETVHCAEQYLPVSASLPLAGRAIHSVTWTICNTLLNVIEASDLDSARASIADLMAYLQWPVWKGCRNCDVDEVCYIPIWPSGRKQDYENPQCQRSIPRQGPGESYWH